MSWFSRRAGTPPRPGADQPGAAATAAAPPPPGGPQSHRSLGLAALLASFAGHERLHVLDLGPAVGGNVEFLSRYGCKLYIQDLYPALVTLQPRSAQPGANENAAPWDRAVVREARETWEARDERERQQTEGGSRSGALGALVSYPDDTRFDAVLVWDLFNYLDRREVAELARQLARYCRPGALVFGLISILKQIPADPMRFRIVDADHLSYEARTPALRPCPRYAPAELNELLRGFQLDRSFLMRHGVQEYLFARMPG